MRIGMDYLGGAKFLKTILEEHPRNWGAGVFSYVDGFGDGLPVAEALAKLGVPFIRVHLMWKDGHDYGKGDLQWVRKEAKRVGVLIKKYPKVQWLISPACEHRFKSYKEWEPFEDAVVFTLPHHSFVLVNSPEKSGFINDLGINEFHGVLPKPPTKKKFGFSFDGTNIVDSDIEAYKKNYKDADYFMVWNCQMNGRRVLKEDPYIPRHNRKFYPVGKQLDSWIYLMTHERGKTKLPKGWIFKSHADQEEVPPQGRSNKPAWVKVPKFKTLELRTRNGQLIDRAKYKGTFKGGGHRFYHSQWGYEMADKAIRIQGDALCDVYADGKKVGVVNPAFRDGSFR